MYYLIFLSIFQQLCAFNAVLDVLFRRLLPKSAQALRTSNVLLQLVASFEAGPGKLFYFLFFYFLFFSFVNLLQRSLDV